MRTGAIVSSENTCKTFIDRRNQLLTARREGSISLSHQEAQTTLRRDVLLLFFIVKHLMCPYMGGLMCQLACVDKDAAAGG